MPDSIGWMFEESSSLGIGDGEKITKKDLVDYGRTDVYIQKIGQDQYYIDFSKDKYKKCHGI